MFALFWAFRHYRWKGLAPAIVLPKAIIHLGCDLLNPLVCQNVIQNQCTAIVLEYVYLPSDATTPPLVRSNSWTAASAQPPF